MDRARSFGNIRKLPSGRYQARYWHLGKQVAADTTFASQTDARRWLATVEADMIRGVWVDPDAGRIPFGKNATRWVAERPVRPRTREIYEGQLRHIVPVFANGTSATRRSGSRCQACARNVPGGMSPGMRDGSRTGASTAPLNAESATGIRDATATPFPSGLTAPEFALRRSRYVRGRPSGEFAGCRFRARYRSEWLVLY